MKICIFILWAVILSVYYGVGGAEFPDYLNYVTISEKGGYLYYEDEYFAEWISRWWLSTVGNAIGNHYLSVDLFAFIVQITYLIWAMSGKDKSEVLAKFWVTVFMGPLFLTTTLRATIPYIMFYQLILGRINFERIVIFGLLSISFHDSALVPFGLALMIYLIFKKSSATNRSLVRLTYVCSFALILFSDYLAPNILPILAGIGLGIRDIYFVNFIPASGYKIAYALFILIMAGVASLKHLSERRVLIVMSMLGASSALFAISSTPAIRMLLYVFGSCLCLLSEKNNFQKIMSNLYVISITPPLILILLFYDLYRNASI